MKNPVKAIEVTGTIDARHRLVLDEPLPIEGPACVLSFLYPKILR